MANLIITSLKCVKQQDTFGRDEVYIYIDGHRSGPYRLGKNEHVDGGIRPAYPFDKTANIVLIESDSGSNADNLGSHKVDPNVVGTGFKAYFHGLNGAAYHMTYDVTA